MSIAYGVSAYNRRRKFEAFLEVMRPSEETTVLDVGFSENEYSETDNFLEKHYPYPDKITALGIDTPDKFLERYPLVPAVKYDGRSFPFKDQAFDICWSNAVLEHVGDGDRQELFLREISRVARTAWVTTPNRNFPLEVHTRTPLLHFLPRALFDKYLSLTGRKWATGDYMNLLSLRDIEQLLARSGISSYRIIKNRILSFTLDFVLVFGEIQAAERSARPAAALGVPSQPHGRASVRGAP